MRFTISDLRLLIVSIILALPSSSALAEDKPPVASASGQLEVSRTVNLEAPDWQTVLDRLFGTPDNGLLDGTKDFRFQAENITLTPEQSAAFFTTDSPQSLSALVSAVESLRGKVQLEGLIAGQPFELKIAGRELKLEGLTLTEAQRQALITELKGITGLHEMKIEALVDGKLTVTKVEGRHEKLEIEKQDHGKLEKPEGEANDRANRDKPEHQERLAGERPEKIEVERVERIEKPERVESGRH